MLWVGVVLLSVSGGLLLLDFLLPYERYRRMKMELNRDNLANMETILKNVAEPGRRLIVEMTPVLLAKERSSFTVHRPAVWCAVVGCGFILFALMCQ